MTARQSRRMAATMLRAGAMRRRDRATEPARRTHVGRCAAAWSPARACRRRELIRFVVDPDGTVVPDIDGRAAGPRLVGDAAARKALEPLPPSNLFAKAAKQSRDRAGGSAGPWSSGCCVAAAWISSAWRAAPGSCRRRLREGARLAAAGPRRPAAGGVRRRALTGGAKLRPLLATLPVVELFTAAELSRPWVARESCMPRWRPADSPTAACGARSTRRLAGGGSRRQRLRG